MACLKTNALDWIAGSVQAVGNIDNFTRQFLLKHHFTFRSTTQMVHERM